MCDVQTQTIRPRRRWRRLVAVVVALCVLALFVALLVWAARPQWYTYVSKPSQTSSALSLAIRLPVGWYCQYNNTIPEWAYVTVRRRPLSGLARWWSEHVFRLDGGPQKNDIFGIVLVEGEGSAVLSPNRMAATYKLAGYAASSRAFKHPLGTAYTITGVWRRPGRPKLNLAEEVEETWIPVYRRSNVSLVAWCMATRTDFRRNLSTWHEIVRSIRVVQK